MTARNIIEDCVGSFLWLNCVELLKTHLPPFYYELCCILNCSCSYMYIYRETERFTNCNIIIAKGVFKQSIAFAQIIFFKFLTLIYWRALVPNFGQCVAIHSILIRWLVLLQSCCFLEGILYEMRICDCLISIVKSFFKIWNHLMKLNPLAVCFYFTHHSYYCLIANTTRLLTWPILSNNFNNTLKLNDWSSMIFWNQAILLIWLLVMLVCGVVSSNEPTRRNRLCVVKWMPTTTYY